MDGTQAPRPIPTTALQPRPHGPSSDYSWVEMPPQPRLRLSCAVPPPRSTMAPRRALPSLLSLDQPHQARWQQGSFYLVQALEAAGDCFVLSLLPKMVDTSFNPSMEEPGHRAQGQAACA